MYFRSIFVTVFAREHKLLYDIACAACVVGRRIAIYRIILCPYASYQKWNRRRQREYYAYI